MNGIRVFLVDDEPDNLGAAEYILEDAGAQVQTESDPVRAAERLLETRPHVVLLDLHMPHLDGESLRAKVAPELPGTCFIALTARTMSGEKQRLMASGFDGYIAKPISIKTFVNEIEAAYARKRG